MNKHIRISVIGLDGLSWSYLSKLINNGITPHIKHIRYLSEKRITLYAYPPMTPPSWASIMTGVNMAKHGIYDFTYVSEDGNIHEGKFIDANNLEHPRIHEMLSFSKSNLKSIIINPIPSYPLYPLKNSIQISNSFFTPKVFFSPSNAERYAKGLSLHQSFKDLYSTLQHGIQYIEEYLDLLDKLLRYEEFNLFWINVPYPDHILHKAMDPAILDRKVISDEKELFGLIDKMIKTLYEVSDITLIISDHGFASYKYLLEINTYLYRKGFVKVLRSPSSSSKSKITISSDSLLVRLTQNKLLRRVAKTFLSLLRIMGKNVKLSPAYVDTTNSIGYLTSRTSFGIKLNNYNMINEIISALYELRGIKKVYRKDELFHGPYIDRLPDIYIEPDFDRGYFIGSDKIWTKIIAPAENEYRLNHHPKGVFILSDKNISHKLPEIIPNYLVANMIMAILGVPLSVYADGLDLIREIMNLEHIETTDLYIKRWYLMKRLRTVIKKK